MIIRNSPFSVLPVAIFLLAAPGAQADDLLDAVLWDGPSAFPSKTAPTPPVPAPSPEPAPLDTPDIAPVPTPSPASALTLQDLLPSAREPAAPADSALPSGTTPAGTDSPKEIPSPSSLLGSLPSPASLFGGAPAAIAPPGNAAPENAAPENAAPAPHPLAGDSVVADSVASGTAPAAPSGKPTRVQDDLGDESPLSPSWTLSFRGGGGPENKALAASVEFVKCIDDTPFDVALRGSFFSRSETRTGSYKETYYTYDYSWYWGWTSREHTRTHYYDYDVEERHWIGDLECIWRPLRGHPFSPYAGVGARYEHIDHSDKDDDGGLSPAGRVGVVLTVPNFDRLSLKGEFFAGKDSNEVVGEVAIRLASHFVLAAFVDSFDTDLGRGTAFGGGFSLPF